MKVEMGKKYQTRAGHSVEVLTTRARGDYPVIAYIGDDCQIRMWQSSGAYYKETTSHDFDLVEVPEFKDRMFFNEAGLPRISVKKPLAVSMDHEEASPEEAREYAATLIKAADYAQEWADSEK